MKAKAFIGALNEAAIIKAIQTAEQRTSGEIRVFVSRKHLHKSNIVEQAHAQFYLLNMHKTAQRNAVLFYLTPEDRKFTVIGDKAIHEKCGESFWNELATIIEKHFKIHQFTEGIVSAIHQTAQTLASHFPRQPNDKNELPDSIATD